MQWKTPDLLLEFLRCHSGNRTECKNVNISDFGAGPFRLSVVLGYSSLSLSWSKIDKNSRFIVITMICLNKMPRYR